MDRDEELSISVRYSGAPFTRGPLDFVYPVYPHETPLLVCVVQEVQFAVRFRFDGKHEVVINGVDVSDGPFHVILVNMYILAIDVTQTW